MNFQVSGLIMFITFEGMDGAGKTTQAKILESKLRSLGRAVVYTREPGGSVLAERIRQIILGEEISDPVTEFLLLCAARRDHVQNVIKPALKDNTIVICDRYIDSSIIYQSVIKGMDRELLLKMHSLFVDGLFPDLTFVLNLKPSDSMKRVRDRGEGQNHYDLKEEAVYEEIYKGFYDIALMYKERVVIIDAFRCVDEVSYDILDVVLNQGKKIACKL